MHCFINGELLPEAAAGVSVRDLGLQRGYGVFDFFKLVDNNPLFMPEHLDRLWLSVEGLGLTVTYTRSAVEKQIRELIHKNNLPHSGIRITITGGPSADGYMPGEASVIITQHSFAPPSAVQQQNGIVLATYNHQRQLPQYKTTDYLMAVWLQPWLQAQGADELLYRNNEVVTECPRSNVFAVLSNKTIITPAAAVLPGITRSKVLEIAATAFKVEERQLSLPELYMAKEVFITSTTKAVLPVRKIDAITFATGPGTVTYQLAQRFAAYCSHAVGEQ